MLLGIVSSILKVLLNNGHVKVSRSYVLYQQIHERNVLVLINPACLPQAQARPVQTRQQLLQKPRAVQQYKRLQASSFRQRCQLLVRRRRPLQPHQQSRLLQQWVIFQISVFGHLLHD